MQFASSRHLLALLCSIAAAAAFAGCDGDSTESQPTAEPESFSLVFSAVLAGSDVACGADIPGVGPDGRHSVGVSDLRFYVSNLRFLDANGEEVEVTLDDNEFQLNSAAGSVALIDLTGNSGGSCEASAIAFAEGTARTNAVITGKTFPSQVTSIAFDIGVPQSLMKEVIANNTLEGAPTPLNEMYWSWASGYRHFVFNFAVTDEAAESGGGYLHIGSRNCGPDDGLALADRENCEFVNTPQFAADFNLASDKVQLDLTALVASVDLVAPIYDPMTFEVIGEGVGAECHSSPMQEDCASVFGVFGLSMDTGAADASKNQLFSVR
jgi:uncharacterized repeat protein (TIGR04052 family)